MRRHNNWLIQIKFVFIVIGYLGAASVFAAASSSSSQSARSRPTTLRIAQSGVQLEFTGSDVFFRRVGGHGLPELRLPTETFITSDAPDDDLLILGATAVDLSDGSSFLLFEEGVSIFVMTSSPMTSTHVARTVDGARLFIVEDAVSAALIWIIAVDSAGQIFASQMPGLASADPEVVNKIRSARSAFLFEVSRGLSMANVKRRLQLIPMAAIVIRPSDFVAGWTYQIPVLEPRTRFTPMSARDASAQMEEPHELAPIPGSSAHVVASFISGRVAVGGLTVSGGFASLRELVDARSAGWEVLGNAPQIRFTPNSAPTDLTIATEGREIKFPIADLLRRACRDFTVADTPIPWSGSNK